MLGKGFPTSQRGLVAAVLLATESSSMYLARLKSHTCITAPVFGQSTSVRSVYSPSLGAEALFYAQPFLWPFLRVILVCVRACAYVCWVIHFYAQSYLDADETPTFTSQFFATSMLGDFKSQWMIAGRRLCRWFIPRATLMACGQPTRTEKAKGKPGSSPDLAVSAAVQPNI